MIGGEYEVTGKDPFDIMRIGRAATHFNAQVGLDSSLSYLDALTQLGLPVPSEPEARTETTNELRRAERQFTWGNKGVGVFSGGEEDRVFWQFAVQKYAKEIGSGVEIVSASLHTLFSPQVLMPTDEELDLKRIEQLGYRTRSGTSDLAKAVSLIASQVRFGEDDPLTFIVTTPTVPTDLVPMFDFHSASTARNPSAEQLGRDATSDRDNYFETDTDDGKERLSEAHNRLDKLMIDTALRSNPDTVDGLLDAIGSQTSEDLSKGLRFYYYKKLLDFVDAGSGYRIVPENVRVAVIADPVAYDYMMARGLHNPYGTVTPYDPEANLGCWSAVPTTGSRHTDTKNAAIDRLRAEVYAENPLDRAITAALIYADIELPRTD